MLQLIVCLHHHFSSFFLSEYITLFCELSSDPLVWCRPYDESSRKVFGGSPLVRVSLNNAFSVAASVLLTLSATFMWFYAYYSLPTPDAVGEGCISWKPSNCSSKSICWNPESFCKTFFFFLTSWSWEENH